MKETVLCYLEKDNHYLMIRQHKQNENDGYWMGIGGKIESNESIEKALEREIKEETNLSLMQYQYRGILEFKDQGLEERIHLFTSNAFTGDIQPSSEGELKWVHQEKLTQLNMWAGDLFFIELIQKDHPFFKMNLVYENRILKKVILDDHPLYDIS